VTDGGGLSLMQADESDADILLRYDGRTLVLLNKSDRYIDVSDLTFVRLDINGSDGISFRAREWDSESVFALRVGDCLQVWTMDFRNLEGNDPPADICNFRQGIRQTSRPFWTTTQDKKYFEVRLMDKLLARCPVLGRVTEIKPENETIDECLIDLPGN
jgi:hypothetical protein